LFNNQKQLIKSQMGKNKEQAAQSLPLLEADAAYERAKTKATKAKHKLKTAEKNDLTKTQVEILRLKATKAKYKKKARKAALKIAKLEARLAAKSAVEVATVKVNKVKAEPVIPDTPAPKRRGPRPMSAEEKEAARLARAADPQKKPLGRPKVAKSIVVEEEVDAKAGTSVATIAATPTTRKRRTSEEVKAAKEAAAAAKRPRRTSEEVKAAKEAATAEKQRAKAEKAASKTTVVADKRPRRSAEEVQAAKDAIAAEKQRVKAEKEAAKAAIAASTRTRRTSEEIKAAKEAAAAEKQREKEEKEAAKAAAAAAKRPRRTAEEIAAQEKAANENLKGADFRIIEGIGLRATQILHDAGVLTYQQLAAANTEDLTKMMKAVRFNFAQPASWPQQAQLVIENRHDELKALQAELKGGVKK
jgi:predicted flap endonuclease-1-like 5' DNA nuclease